jgi:hypothetical protein
LAEFVAFLAMRRRAKTQEQNTKQKRKDMDEEFRNRKKRILAWRGKISEREKERSEGGGRESVREKRGGAGKLKETKRETTCSTGDKDENKGKGECKQGYTVNGQLTCRPNGSISLWLAIDGLTWRQENPHYSARFYKCKLRIHRYK